MGVRYDLRRSLRPLDLADPNYAQRLLNIYSVEAVNNQGDVTRVYWFCGKIGVNSVTVEKVKATMSDMDELRKYTIIFIKFGDNCTVTPPARKDLGKPKKFFFIKGN